MTLAKSPDAFRTISEVAEWLDTPAHVLRFWESKFTQVKPIKRAGGRRYYRPNDMRLLGGIKKLLHEDGMTIKGVQKLLRTEGINNISALSMALEIDETHQIDAAETIIAAIEPEAEPEPVPEPIPEPEPTPEPEPIAEPALAPDPEPIAEPELIPEPELMPEPIQEPEPEQITVGNPELSLIFNRLEALHEKIKDSIEPKTTG